MVVMEEGTRAWLALGLPHISKFRSRLLYCLHSRHLLKQQGKADDFLGGIVTGFLQRYCNGFLDLG